MPDKKTRYQIEINTQKENCLILKNVEKINIWDAYEQAIANSGDYEPLVVIKKNGKKPLAVVDAEYFISLFGEKK